MHRRVPLSEDTVDTTAEDAPAGLRLAARRDLCNVRVQPDQPFPTVPAVDGTHAKGLNREDTGPSPPSFGLGHSSFLRRWVVRHRPPRNS